MTENETGEEFIVSVVTEERRVNHSDSTKRGVAHNSNHSYFI